MNNMQKPIIIAGLEAAGKTSVMCSIIELAKRRDIQLAGFLPFETKMIKKYATDSKLDGQIICEYMTGEPMVNLVAPYIAHEDYPVELAYRRDGIKADMGFLKERLSILSQHYSQTMVEMCESLYSPINEDYFAVDWMQLHSNDVLYVIKPGRLWVEWNLAEISILKQKGFNVVLMFNNTVTIKDQDLLFYTWEKIEKLTEQQIEGMIPFIPDMNGDLKKMADVLEEHVPGIFKKLIHLSKD